MSQYFAAHRFSNPAMRVALIAVFTGVALGTNYAMIDIPNVKLMDALVFVAAFLFGLQVGLGTAISIWFVYGFINPYGQADLPTYFFVTLGECFYALSGVLLSRASAGRDVINNGVGHGGMSLLFGLVGFLATFAYDLLTNFGTWLFRASSPSQALIIGTITGAPFSILHETSNLIFFATVVPLAISASRRMGIPLPDRLREP